MKLKRLWDTDNKKIVWVEWPSGKLCQAWTDESGDYIYVYDNWKWNASSAGTVTWYEYWPVWKQLGDEEVGFYDTNVPTNLYSWDGWDKAAYRFMNWTTVLQSWTVDEWETPEYTWDTPTKSATAQYTYTFSGWDPTVWPITKKTDFKAQFTSTVNEYDITIVSSDTDKGTVDVAAIDNAPYGTKISAAENVLTIWEWASATVVTATAWEWYVFSSWGTLPSSVTGDLTITATFTADL